MEIGILHDESSKPAPKIQKGDFRGKSHHPEVEMSNEDFEMSKVPDGLQIPFPFLNKRGKKEE